jgi:hypothetical protein
MKETSWLFSAVLLAASLASCTPPCDTATSSCAEDAGSSVCPALTGTVIEHSHDITSDETWAGDGTVHVWVTGASIRPGATLTIAGCGVVQVRPSIGFTLRGASGMPAGLVTQGTASRPVLITNVPGSGPWSGIVSSDANQSVSLSYTTLENGGAGAFRGSMINLNAAADPGTTVTPMLKVDHVTVKHSAGTGVVLAAGAAFTPDSTELSVLEGGLSTADGNSAIEIGQLAAGTLPTLHVSGNVVDQIRVSASPGTLNISRDLTLKNRGVPYYFYFDRVRVTDPQGPTVPTLTIEAGVELRFDDYLVIGSGGAGNPAHPGKLLALGTAASPIVFTSAKATRAAGDWPGVWFREAAGSRLENVLIDFAGGANGISSSNCKPAMTSDNASLFLSAPAAASDFVAVRIDHARSHAINAMWNTAGFGPDLTAGFTFGALGGCRQTKNATPTGCMNAEGCLVP